MNVNTSVVIILVIALFAFFLIWSWMNSRKNSVTVATVQPQQPQQLQQLQQPIQPMQVQQASMSGQPTRIEGADFHDLYREQPSGFGHQPRYEPRPQITQINIEGPDSDPYSDPIKKQDLYTMYDPLTYPQARLPREILEKYDEYYKKHGVYPNFGEHSKPLFDNATQCGVLVQHSDDEDIYNNSIASIPLFRLKNVKNNDRYYYYILDQRAAGKLEPKIPLDELKINDRSWKDGKVRGLPEITDGDIIKGIPIHPSQKFKAVIYAMQHFP
jgi:hypothetical protein